MNFHTFAVLILTFERRTQREAQTMGTEKLEQCQNKSVHVPQEKQLASDSSALLIRERTKVPFQGQNVSPCSVLDLEVKFTWQV